MRVEAYGTLDEANSFIGLAHANLRQHGELFQDLLSELIVIQHELFDCGGDLAAVKPRKEGKLTEASVTVLEERMDVYVEEAAPLTKFILPGGQEGALLHVARTVVRRAERHIVTLAKQEEIPAAALTYVNRLSDYLFAAARIVNHRLGEADVEYERSADVFRSK